MQTFARVARNLTNMQGCMTPVLFVMQVEAAEQAKKTASQAEAHAALQQQVQQQAAAIAALQIQLASVTTQADASASPPRQQAADASNAGTGVDENTVSGKQGGVAWRTRCFTVRWSGGSHRFL